MGLFSDTCQALIDPATGKMLTGAELERARTNPNAPRCGTPVSKRARFCSKCGAPAPKGWWQCPACGKWISNQSNFCGHCRAPLHIESRDVIEGGRWRRAPQFFAERIEISDLKRLLAKGLIVEPGTAAILIEAGVYKDVLDAGTYTLDGLLRRINHWGNPPPRTAILVETGDVVIPLRIENLRSAEEFPLVLVTEVVFRFDEKRAEQFMANLLKGTTQFSYEQLQNAFVNEIRFTATNVCTTTTVDDLVKDPKRRIQLEDALRDTLAKAFDRYGLALVRLTTVEFTGPKYEELRDKALALDVKRREVQFEIRERELLLGSRKSEKELEEASRQLAADLDIGDEQRNHALDRLTRAHRHEAEKDEAAFQWQQEIDQAQTAASVQKITVEAEAGEAERWIEVDRKKHKQKIEEMAETAKLFEGKNLQTILASLPDAARREHLLELQRDANKTGRSPMEILALAAEHSPDAVKALANLLGREQMEKDFKEKQRLMEEAADRLESVLKAALATKTPPGAGTTVNKY